MSQENKSTYYITPKEARKRQQELRERIRIEPYPATPRTIAGADISFNRGSDELHAGFIVFDYATLQPLALALASVTVHFPYVPGLLSFREIPALMQAWQLLEPSPDIVVVDGHGIAHPRRMGIATQFGIEAGQPTLGCAKNVLTGTHEEPENEQGASTDLMDKEEKIGLVYRSRQNVKPIIVSPGHRVSFGDVQRIISHTLTGYKLPITTRRAHNWVNKLRKGVVAPGYYEAPLPGELV